MNIETRALDTLHEDPSNVRTHGERNRETIAASLTAFGQVEPLVVQASSGRVIGGNGRLVVMRELGWDSAEVVELDIDDTRAAALAIALNRTAELAEWDKPSLATMLHTFDPELLEATGFEEHDIAALEWEPIPPDDALDTGDDSLLIARIEGIKPDDRELVERTVNEALGPLGLGLECKVT